MSAQTPDLSKAEIHTNAVLRKYEGDEGDPDRRLLETITLEDGKIVKHEVHTED